MKIKLNFRKIDILGEIIKPRPPPLLLLLFLKSVKKKKKKNPTKPTTQFTLHAVEQPKKRSKRHVLLLSIRGNE